MRLCFLRAGDAVPEGPDAARWLTTLGRDETRRVAEALDFEGVRPTRIVSSPLVRAVQTAEILAHRTRCEGPVEIDSALLPSGGPRASLDAHVAGATDEEVLCFVGHAPLISTFVRAFVRDAFARPFPGDAAPTDGLRRSEVLVLLRQGGEIRLEHRLRPFNKGRPG